jgi:hypothetical protein
MKLSGGEDVTVGFTVMGYAYPEEPEDTWLEIELTITTPHGSGIGRADCARNTGVQWLADWLQTIGERREPSYRMAGVEDTNFQLRILAESPDDVRLEAYLILEQPGEWATLAPNTSDRKYWTGTVELTEIGPKAPDL